MNKVADGKEGTTVRRRGRPRKQQTLQGKRLFDDQSSSEDEDPISGSDQDVDAEDKEEEDELLIHSLRASSKLRSLRVSKSQTRTVDSSLAAEDLATPKTSGTYDFVSCLCRLRTRIRPSMFHFTDIKLHFLDVGASS